MNDNHRRDHIGMISWLMFGGIAVFFIVCWVMNYWGGESRWLLPLFFLPLGLQFFCSAALYLKPREERDLGTFYKFFVVMMTVCIGSYCLLWAAYLYYEKLGGGRSYELFKFLSGVAVFCIVILIGFVVLMTVVILGTQNNHEEDGRPRQGSRLAGKLDRLRARYHRWLDSLKAGVSEAPAHALSLFFSAFLAVSYLFGFAFAFHDKSLSASSDVKMSSTSHDKGVPGQTPALYMKNFYLGESSPTPTPVSGEWSFQFEEGRAIPDIEQNKAEDQDKDTKKREIADRRDHNNTCLEEITQKLAEATKGGNKVRVVLTGRANEKPVVGVPYLSNYELSNARAQNVAHAIMEKLTRDKGNEWRNIEWVLISASNEMPALPLSQINAQGKEVSKSAVSRPEDKVVEAHIEPISQDPMTLQMQRFEIEREHPQNRPLDLIDYIYFANYTVTTTGYGDIIPLTPYAKFICSLANICEVFFLVVFFNALLSLKRDKEIVVSPLAFLLASGRLGRNSSGSENPPPQE